MSDILSYAVSLVKRGVTCWVHYIVDNETGGTGSHQAGFYLPKGAASIAFDFKCEKGHNYEHFVKIKWYDYKETDSRFVYYGTGTRNEYRLTRFGRGFPFLNKEMSGNLLVLVKIDSTEYEGVVLQNDEDIDEFLAIFNISPTEINQLISVQNETPEEKFDRLIKEYLETVSVFPSTLIMSEMARSLYISAMEKPELDIKSDYDKAIIRFIEAEYVLFRAIEQKLCLPDIQKVLALNSVDEFVQYANSIVNRRKSRAGKSLENHLSKIFKLADLKFEEQVVTENRSKPDFIFPSAVEYHDFNFPAKDLICLGAKTTCKDRWRQVIEEADRIETKHLFTLQQGISRNQLAEMYDRKICLVVPQSYKNTFDKDFRNHILSLKEFIQFVEKKQEKQIFSGLLL